MGEGGDPWKLCRGFVHIIPLYSKITISCTFSLSLSLSHTHTRCHTSHNKEEEDHDGSVAKVEQIGEGPSDGGLVDKVVDGEEEEIEGRGARGEEGPPPPAVVLRTEVEVAEEDGGLGADHHQHKVRQHDETKHVVHLTRPTVYMHMYVMQHNVVNRIQRMEEKKQF